MSDEDIYGKDTYKPSIWQRIKNRINCWRGNHFPTFIYTTDTEAVNYCVYGCGYVFDWGQAKERELSWELLDEAIEATKKDGYTADWGGFYTSQSNVESIENMEEDRMTGYTPPTTNYPNPKCTDCPFNVCKDCGKCHTWHCDSEQLCEYDKFRFHDKEVY